MFGYSLYLIAASFCIKMKMKKTIAEINKNEVLNKNKNDWYFIYSPSSCSMRRGGEVDERKRPLGVSSRTILLKECIQSAFLWISNFI